MSCYRVSDEHINVMVWAIGAYGVGAPQVWDGTEYLPAAMPAERARIGRILAEANAASVNRRYDEERETRYRWAEPASTMWTPVEIIKACDGYAYQACEAPDWEHCRAKRITDAIRNTAIHALGGYEAAPWEITRAAL